jgi:uncharacterized protein (DUF924 family)
MTSTAPRTPPDTAADLPSDARDVLDFWFGDGLQSRPEWFRKDPAFDAQIRDRFGSLIDPALRGELTAWMQQPASALAHIVLLDQFTRNVFRDTPRAFAGDTLALQAAQDMVARGFDRRLTPRQRSFVYLPFEHAEDRAMQQESLRLFGQLADEHPEVADLLEWARKHQVIVERFGRFPHRNQLLGRDSTPQELAFLSEPGSRF